MVVILLETITTKLVRESIQSRNGNLLKDIMKIEHPDETYTNYIVNEYDGDVPRLFGDKRTIELMVPREMDIVMENAVVDAIESGTIFDDKRDIENKVDYLSMTHLPHAGMMHRHMHEPHETVHAIGAIIGAMNNKGRFGSEDSDMKNGSNYTLDLTKHGDEKDTSVMDLTKDYLNIKDKEKNGCPKEFRRSLAKVPDEIEDIKKVKAEDTVDKDDYDEIGLDYEEEDPDDKKKKCDDDDECDDKEESKPKKKSKKKDTDDDDIDFKDEGVADGNDSSYEPAIVHGRGSGTTTTDTPDTNTKSSYEEAYQPSYDEYEMYQETHAILVKPKKLKPIPRDVVAYIITQKNAIRDTNDQAMISGYCCSKLELVDFYLNCIDTHDYRYIVPHNRQYLVQMQNDLNHCLQEILRVKPVNRLDRVWKLNVTYPEGWGG